MSDFPYRLMMVTIFNDHEVGFKSPEAINSVFELNLDLTDDQAEKIRTATANGTPLFAGFDPFHQQINGFNEIILADTRRGVTDQQEESGRQI